MAFSVVDESRKRRKESTQAGGSTLGSVPSSGSGFSVARESMRRRGLFENQDNDYSSWNNDTYNLSKRLQNEWEARKDQFQDKNQFKSYQNSVLQETGDLLRRAYASRDYYTQYGDQYSNRDQILKDINQNIDYLNDVRGGIVSEGQYWDQFENEDSYNAYKNMAAALADPVTDGIDSKELNNRLEEMKLRQSELKNQLSERENSGDMGGTTLLRREYDRMSNQLNALQKDYKDNFFGQFGASYTQGRLSQDEAQAWNDYLTLPTEENRKRAETLSAVLKQFQSQNEEVLKDDADLPLISQSLAGYLPQFLDQTKATISGGLVGFGAGSAVPVLGSLAGAKAGATAASGAYSYNTMRGSAFRDLLKLGVDEETARAAANDEAIVSAMIEMGDTLMDVSGLSYGVGSIIDVARKGLTKKFAKEGAEAVAESAAKKLLKGLGRYGLTVGGEAVEEGAQQAVSIANRERLKDGGSGIPDLAKRSVGTGWDALRGANPEARAEILEAAGEGGKIAALMGGLNAGFTAVGNRVLNTNTEHRQSVNPVEKAVEQVESPVLSEQRNSGINLRDNLEPTLIEDEMRKGNRQITGKSDIQSQTVETAPYSALGQAERQETSIPENHQQVTGKLTDRNVLQDDSLDSQIRQAEERAVQSAYKAGLAGMSEKAIPTDNPIELKAYTTGREERRRRIGEAERAGYGDMGTKAFMGVVEKTGAEPGRARLEFQSAYEQGLTNAPRENVVLRSEIQKEAYKAGLLDRAASMKHDTQVSIGTRHGKGGLIQNEYSAKLDTKLASTLHKIGSATGTRIVMDGRLVGSDANGYYENGEIHLSPDAENPLMQVVKHELTHHLQELAPAEYRAFRDYAVQLESAGTWNIYGSSTATETMRERYLSASKGRVNLTTEGAMDEIAAHYAERILSDETTLANFINHVTQSESPQTRSMGQKFFESVRAFVDKVKRIFKGDTAQMDRAARDEFGTTVEQLERAEQLWKEAYRAAEKNAQISSDFVKAGAAASLEAEKNADQQDGVASGAAQSADNGKRFDLKDRISVGMSEENRYAILKDREVHIPRVNTEKLSNIDPDDFAALETSGRGPVFKILRKIGEQFGVYKDYHNVDLELDFGFSKGGLFESVHKQGAEYQNYARMLSVFDDVVEGAIGIEAHTNRYKSDGEQVKATYVFVSGFSTDTGIIPTLFEVREFIDETKSTMRVAVSLHEIEKSRIVAYNTTNVSDGSPYTLPASDIRIADLFANVNVKDGRLLKYIPDNFLNNAQQQAKQQALIEQAKYIENKNAKKFSLKERSDLTKENAKLREVNAALREQFKTTKFAKVDRKSLDTFTRRLLKDYSSSTDFDTVRESLDKLYTYLANGEDQMPPSWQEAYQQAYETAVSILEAVQVQDDQLYQDYKALRDRLRTAGVTLREEYSHDLQGYESLSDFRKHYIGRLKITSDGLPVDVLYQELAEDYPEFFSPDVTNPADQLVLMGDVLDDLRPVIGNPYSHNMREAATWLANDIMERFFELPQAKPTFADKAARKLDAQKAASAQKLDAQKSESARKLDAQKEEAAQRLDRQQLADQMYHGRKMAEQQNKQAQQLEKNREKQRQRVQKLLEDNRARMELLRAEEQVRREKALDQLEEKYTRKLDRLTKRNHKAQAQNQKYRDRMKEGRERRKSKALRERIFRHTNQLSQKLLHPNDKQHIPENLRGTVLALLESINLESGYETVLGKDGLYHQVERGTDLGAEQTNKTHAFRALKKLYADLSQGGELVVDPSLLGGEGIQNAFDAVLEFAEIPIDNLNSAQLQTLWEVLRAVEHSINTAGKILSAAKFQRTQDWADALVSDTASRRKRKGSALEKWRLDLENPYTFFSHYGEAGKAIFRMLRDAQDHQQEMVSQLQKETEKIADSKTIREWDREIHTFTTERGQELKLTSAHCMELYLLSRREQAQDHLMKGGIVQPEIKHSRIYRGTEAVLLSEADLKAIAGLLTSAQVKVADALQRLTSTTLANFGNEASMKAYGYQKFTEENYWPIRSAAEGIHSSVEKGGNNPRSIKNIGLAKSVIPHANNPVDISGVFQTFSRHAGDMTDYAAWLCPMEDANRLFNYQFRDELGEKTGQTVKGLLDRVGGRGAKDYWFRLMEDIQNGIKMTSDTAVMGAVSKGIGNARGASVSWNIRVIVQQPTAILRAAAVLSPADMAVGLVTGGGWETALKYSAIARRKEMGGFDLSAPAQMRELLFDDQKNAVQRIDELGTLGAAKADALTWGRIWNACEQATKRQHGNLAVGSLAFYEETAKLFDEVIDQTQVVDGVLQRSQVMRSSDSVVNHATAFMGEPIMAMNLLIRSWDAFRGESDTKKRQMAMRTFGRAVAALVVTNAFNAFAQSLVDGIRDDDDEKYWERVQRAFWGVTGEEESTSEKMKNLVLEGNLAGNLNPVAQIPFLKDILSIISGYSVYRADAAVLEDIIQAGKDFTDSIRGEGKKTVLYALKNLTQQAGKILGISAPNMMRDIYGALRSIAVETGDVAAQYELEKWIYTMQNTGNKGRFVDLAYQAYVQKDMGLYTRIVQELMENGVEATYIENRMKSLAKKESGRSDSQQFPSVDVWGRPSSYVPKAEKGPVEQELLRLFVATGKGNVFPSKADQKFVIDEEEKILTAEEYTRYATVRGQTAYKLITDLISSKAYKQMSDKEKLDVVKIAYDYANQTAKAAVSKFEPDKWVEYMKSVRAECGISQGTFLALKSMVKGIEGLKDAWKVDEDGKPVTITNSEGLLIMEKVYDSKLVTGLTSDQLKILFEYLGVGKNVRHYSAALVRQKLGEMRKRSVG